MHKAVSLFTGAGGLDLGLEAAGFSTAVAVEYNSHACNTLRENLSEEREWSVIEGDIHDVTSKKLMESGNLKVGESAILIGGPPCQPFSKSAFWTQGDTKRLDDPRADTLTAYLRVLRDLQPKAFLLENVFGLTYKGKDEALLLLQNTIHQINKEVGTNYSFHFQVLNCANYGVPQVRERVFIIGERDGREFIFPKETHSNPEIENDKKSSKKQLNLLEFPTQKLEDWTTAWDAIGDLNDLEHEGLQMTGRWAELLPSIPEGKNYLHHTERGDGLPLFGWRRRYWSFLLKLAKNRPSWTIQAQPGSAIGPFHWLNRRLSARELLRLQTFPDTYMITGGRTEVQRQIGNAVPSLMGEVLGRAIREQLLDDPVDNSIPLKLLPIKQASIPEIEPLLSVPDKYIHLIGEHTAHPGTGKGYSVVQK